MKLEITINPEATVATIKMDEQTVVMQLSVIEDVYRMIESHLRRIEKSPTEYKAHKEFGSTIKQYGGKHSEVVLNPEKFFLTRDTIVPGVGVVRMDKYKEDVC